MSDDEKYVKWFENACYLNELLYDYLCKEIKEQKPTKYYSISYFLYFRKSDYHNVGIELKGIKGYRTMVSIQTMLYDAQKPYRLSLWKYNGEHIDKNYDFEIIQEKDFPLLLDYIKQFYGLQQSHGFEQLTLF